MSSTYWMPIITCQSHYHQRHNHNIECHGYSLFVASHMYVLGHTLDVIVHVVYKLFCCLLVKHRLNEYIYHDYLIKFKVSIYSLLTGCKTNLSLTSLDSKFLNICFTRGSDRPEVSSQLISLVHIETEVHTSTLLIKISKLRWKILYTLNLISPNVPFIYTRFFSLIFSNLLFI